MGGDIGAVQSRIDPHYIPDYYSEKKITVTPLNFVCKPRAPLLRATHNARSDSDKDAEHFFARAILREIFAKQRSADVMRLSLFTNF
ncbi:MAG TPA: hypothetical protein VHU22_04930 [Xanthobacteraceae bacterium]|nr:hypothetical protein [Xanthobacteraceae bacterium]